MEKAELIKEIIELQRRLSQVLIPYAMEPWRKLDVPLAQLKSLFIIVMKGDTNFRTLAHDLGVTPGNVTGIVDRLVEQGLASREPGLDDRRTIQLKATDKGRELLTGLTETHTGLMVDILEHMSDEDLNSLLRGLSGFIKAVEEYQAKITQ
jgi:DNA-binding MarR family transcriptional regulator